MTKSKKKRGDAKDFFLTILEFEKKLAQELEIKKLLKYPPKTYRFASHIAKKGLATTNQVLANGLDALLERDVGIKPVFFVVFDFIPEKIQKYIKLLIPLFLFLFMMYLPLDIPLAIKKSLGIFLAISFMWTMESLPLPVTSLLVPVMFVATGIMDEKRALVPFAHPVVYLLMGGLILAEAFRKHKLDKKTALYILTKSKGNINHILLSLMILTFVFSMWVSSSATVALLVPVVIGIVGTLKEGKKKLMTKFLLAIGVSSALGGMATITGSTPNAVASAFLSEKISWTFLDWMRIGLPVSVAIFVMIYFLFRFLFRSSVSEIDMEGIQRKQEELGGLTRSQLKLMTIFIPTILLWIFGSKIIAAYGLPSSLGNAGVIALVSIILLFSFRLVEWSDAKTIAWDVLLLIGGGLALGDGLVASGAAAFLAEQFVHLIRGMSLLILIMVISSLTILITNLVNNTATVAIMVPILINIGENMGLDIRLFVLVCALSSSIAFITPIGHPTYSIIYGTGLIDRKDMVKSGLLMSIPSMLIISLLLYGVF